MFIKIINFHSIVIDYLVINEHLIHSLTNLLLLQIAHLHLTLISQHLLKHHLLNVWLVQVKTIISQLILANSLELSKLVSKLVAGT